MSGSLGRLGVGGAGAVAPGVRDRGSVASALRVTGATLGLISAIASIDLRIAAPIVVPRPVVRPSIGAAAARPCWSSGATASWANPEKTTRPILVPSSCVSTNSRTAACAAASRFGLDVGRAHRPGHVERRG